ncbi:hypothetical protein L218DRAFT_1076612 [Marasmius fiardii PR-910]|nr:hypothetical protein L218DRAFT_1076612 [Marasmius fiardii PR-910]
MRLYCRVAVRSFIFITIFPFSKALTINALPATVTDGQVETVTWTRDQDKDPTHFQFIQTRGSQLYLPIGPTFSVKKEQTQGTFAVTFTGAGSQVMIWANNLDKPFPSPFFWGPQIIIVGKPSAPTLPTTIVSVTQTSSTPPPTIPTESISTVPTSTLTTGSQTSGQAQPPVVPSTDPVVISPTTTINDSTTNQTGEPNNSVAQHTSSGAVTTGNRNTPPSSNTTNTNDVPGNSTGQTSAPSHPGSSHVGVIVGVIFGALALITLILLAIRIRRRSGRKRDRPDAHESFFREKMMTSDGHVPTPNRSDLEPLRYTRDSIISQSTTVYEAGNGTTNGSNYLSSNAKTRHAPGTTVYTINESECADSDHTSTTERSEDQYVFVPRTDRQMDIEHQILQLQEQLVKVLDQRSHSTTSLPKSRPASIGEIRDQIKRLRVLQDGQWARGRSDEVPMEMYSH